MDIRSKLYPYPVLSDGTDDYTGSSFSFSLEVNKGPCELIFSVIMELNDSVLQEKIHNNEAQFLIHIECPYTAYREALCFTENNYERHILEKNLNGNVSVCGFIIAKNDIKDYSNPAFNSDYCELTFDIEKGGILAVGGQYNITVTKDTEELAKIPSIFTICRCASDNDDSMKIDIDGDKIAINLCSEDFQNYKLLSTSPSFMPVFHSMLIMPSLIYVFETIRREGTEDYETRRWYQALKKTLGKHKITLTEESLAQYPSFELAQKLLELPMNKALSSLVSLGDTEDEQ